MKNHFFWILIGILLLLSTGCTKEEGGNFSNVPSDWVQEENASTSALNLDETNTDHAEEIIDPSINQERMKNEPKLFKKSFKAPFLVENPIEMKRYEDLTTVLSDVYDGSEYHDELREVSYDYYGIDGLLDKEVQQSLNEKIKNDQKNAFEQDTDYHKTGVFKQIPHITANVNQVIAFEYSFRPYRWSAEGFVYRLTDGKRLSLQDLFTEGTDFKALLKEKFLLQILYEEGEEAYLENRNKIQIEDDYRFILYEDRLLVDHNYEVLLSEIDDHVHIFDTYWDAKNELYERKDSSKSTNNIYLDEKKDVFKLEKGNLHAYSLKIGGYQDKVFQKKINEKIEESIQEVITRIEEDEIHSMSFSKFEANNHIGDITVRDIKNEDGILILERKVYRNNMWEKVIDEAFTAVYKFDLIEGKVL